MISVEREAEMRWLWEQEVDEEDEEWRDGLTDEESDLVGVWDAKWSNGVSRICQRILELQKRDSERGKLA